MRFIQRPPQEDEAYYTDLTRSAKPEDALVSNKMHDVNRVHPHLYILI